MGRQPPQAIIEAAQACQRNWGVPACISVGQWAFESGWGSHMSGHNNPFGIKAMKGQPATVCLTREVIDGKSVHIPQRFRDFDSLAEAFHEHGRLLATGSAYVEARKHLGDPLAYARALQGHYATDPHYGAILTSIITGSDLTRFDLPGPRTALADLPVIAEPQGKPVMSKFLSAGGIAGLLSFASAMAAAFGKNGLASVFGDPSTAATASALVAGVGAIVAGLLPNKKKAAA